MIPLGVQPNSWVKMPCGWQTDPDKHRAINDMPTGQAIAALKLYIGLCCKANFKGRTDLPSPGCARITLSKLCELTGLSRPMVVAGLRGLRELELIAVLAQRPAVYCIKDYESASYWTKLPRSYFYGSRPSRCLAKLADLTSRRSATLHALQLYLYLASIRDKRTLKATVSYTHLDEVLHLSRNEIARGLFLLVAHDLIGVRSGDMDPKTKQRATNVYWLLGRVGEPGEGALVGVVTATHKVRIETI